MKYLLFIALLLITGCSDPIKKLEDKNIPYEQNITAEEREFQEKIDHEIYRSKDFVSNSKEMFDDEVNKRTLEAKSLYTEVMDIYNDKPEDHLKDKE